MRNKKPAQVRVATGLFYLALALTLATPFVDSGLRMRLPGEVILVSATAVFTVFLIEFIAIGKNWARIIYLVLTVLALPLSILYLKDGSSTSRTEMASDVILLLADGIGLYLLFTAPGKFWFGSTKR